MPTFIKTGFWDKWINNNPQQAKAPKGWLNLDQFVKANSGGSITVNGNGPVTNLNIINPPPFNDINIVDQYFQDTDTLNLYLRINLPYKAYRAKIAMQSIDWPGYGYLYNWFAVTDARKLENPSGGTGLTAPNEWRVPSVTDWTTLSAFVSGNSTELKSKLTSTAYPFYGWLLSAGTDLYNFSALPGGRRSALGEFLDIGNSAQFWTSTGTVGSATMIFIDNVSNNFITVSTLKENGLSVRLVREATAGELLLNDGDTSDTSSLDPYTGNDGKSYVTVKIGTQIWLAQNLRETKYNDNSDIFNASNIFGGNVAAWTTYGNAGVGAWTAYLYNNNTSFPVEYDPTTVKLFYNDVLENTLNKPSGFPLWIATSDVNGPIYQLDASLAPWQKTHIKVTPAHDVSDFPTINERSLLIQEAVTGNNTIIFRPTKRDNTGAITIEDLNNYNDLLGGATSYVYVEILEYTPAYYNQAVGIGLSNL